jgi:hypothetical protein
MHSAVYPKVRVRNPNSLWLVEYMEALLSGQVTHLFMVGNDHEVKLVQKPFI